MERPRRGDPLCWRRREGLGDGGCVEKGVKEAVESHAKEVLVQAREDIFGRALYDLQGDRTGWSPIPRLVTPLLNEVRIAFRQAEDFVQGNRFKGDTDLLGWILKGLRGICSRKLRRCQES